MQKEASNSNFELKNLDFGAVTVRFGAKITGFQCFSTFFVCCCFQASFAVSCLQRAVRNIMLEVQRMGFESLQACKHSKLDL